MYALVDGNNFYVSCERVFRPSLREQPVIVLSNNDGCAVARSEEAKKLGVKMAQPWFELQHLRSKGLIALSANFELYGDMSDRMMSLIGGLGDRAEIYSVDESFVTMDGIQGDLADRARRLRARILTWIGIPTCVGIAETKTLAKLANHIAKDAERKPGSYPSELAQVCNLAALAPAARQHLYSLVPVGEVWGIGRRLSQQLIDVGVQTVAQFLALDRAFIRSRWGVVMERTWQELHGIPCLELEVSPPARKEIASTRSFGAPVTELDKLERAVSAFVTMAAAKLRMDGSCAGQVMTFIRTSPFRKGPQYSRSAIRPLVSPSDSTPALTRAALEALRAIYRPGFPYMKAGVMLMELRPAGLKQGELDLFSKDAHPDRAGNDRLMRAADLLNDRFGKGTVQVASMGAQQDGPGWDMRQTLRTPAYTTRWQDIPQVIA